jgi:L-ascorbate metabolism protein UlaG (beta-lactamase superfamily)
MKGVAKKILAGVVCALLAWASPLGATCRDMDVAHGLTRSAYAAEPDATIQYFGHNFFQIITRKGTRIVTDPLGPRWYPTPSVLGHVVTVGREHFNHNFVAIVQGNPLVLRGLIHFGADWNRVSVSVRDVFIYNVPVYQNGVDGGSLKGAAFIFDLGVLCIAHLGDLSHPLTPEQLKQIGKVDIALTPIGGTFTMGPDIAQHVLGQLKPKIAIPMHFRDDPSILREFTHGLKARYQKGDTLTVSKASLPAATEIIVLRPKGAADYE